MFKRFAVLLIGAILLSCPTSASAEYRHDRDYGRRGYEGRRYGMVVRRIPPGYRTIHWRNTTYLYCDGFFYRYSPVGYVIVEPPAGVVVPTLPPGYRTLTAARNPYYFYDGTYYVSAPSGYAVVQAPPQVVAAPPVAPIVVAAPAPVTTVPASSPLPVVHGSATAGLGDDIDTVEIHIPNTNGSYTMVTLKRTEKGFLGPQGEFYADHPTVDDLRKRYGKS
ncbi:MAG: DUF6515 family protein [Candidatus Omnitrophota bacterium]